MQCWIICGVCRFVPRDKFETRWSCSQSVDDLTSEEEKKVHEIWLKGIVLAVGGRCSALPFGFQVWTWYSRMFVVQYLVPPDSSAADFEPRKFNYPKALWILLPPEIAPFLAYPPPGEKDLRSNEKARKGGAVACLTWRDERGSLDVGRCWPGNWRSWFRLADHKLVIFEDKFAPMMRRIQAGEIAHRHTKRRSHK